MNIGNTKSWVGLFLIFSIFPANVFAEEVLLSKEGAKSKGKTIKDFKILPPLDPHSLEKIYTEDQRQPQQPLRDEQLGVLIVVDKKGGTPNSYINSSGETHENPFPSSPQHKGAHWLLHTSTRPEGVTKTYIKKHKDTIKAIVKKQKFPLMLRYQALRDIYGLEFTSAEQLELIDSGAKDRRAAMRYMAVLKASEYTDLSKAIPICVRSMSDPCTQVAHTASQYLARWFDLVDPKTGRELNLRSPKSGFPGRTELIKRKNVHYVAKSLHAIRPDLIDKVTLGQILQVKSKVNFP